MKDTPFDQSALLDLKVKFLEEHLDNGGLEKILDKNLVQDIVNAKFDNGKINPLTITPRMYAFMKNLLVSQLTGPVFSPEHTSYYMSLLQKDRYFEQTTINTPEEFESIYNSLKNSKDLLFRGQGEAKWRPYNKLQRHWIEKRLFEKRDNYQTLLEKMVFYGRKLHRDQIAELLEKDNIDVEKTTSLYWDICSITAAQLRFWTGPSDLDTPYFLHLKESNQT